MQATIGSIDITAAGHDHPLRNAFENTHEHFGILTGEGQHIQHDLRSLLLKYIGEVIDFTTLTDDAVDFWWKICLLFPPVKNCDFMSLFYQVAYGEWTSEAGTAEY